MSRWERLTVVLLFHIGMLPIIEKEFVLSKKGSKHTTQETLEVGHSTKVFFWQQAQESFPTCIKWPLSMFINYYSIAWHSKSTNFYCLKNCWCIVDIALRVDLYYNMHECLLFFIGSCILGSKLLRVYHFILSVRFDLTA